MTRILILEDAAATTNVLVPCLEEAMPGAVVQTAATADEALQLARESSDSGQPYDIVILDAKVPQSEGANPDVHPMVCLDIGRKAPNALIVHFTAYPTDSAVTEQLYRQLKQQMAGRVALIDKNDPDYMAKLLQMANRFIYETRIQTSMTNLFGDASVSRSGVAYGRSPAMSVAHVTQELAALTRDISAHWSYLSEPMQSRIRDVFFIDDHRHPVYVSLLPPENHTAPGQVPIPAIPPEGSRS